MTRTFLTSLLLLVFVASLLAMAGAVAQERQFEKPGPKGGGGAPPSDAPASQKPLSSGSNSTLIIVIVVVAVIALIAAFALKKKGVA